jgi:hypothetical protein
MRILWLVEEYGKFRMLAIAEVKGHVGQFRDVLTQQDRMHHKTSTRHFMRVVENGSENTLRRYVT